MTTTEKREIAYKLKIYIGGYSSQKKAVETLDGVSEATVISILRGDEQEWSKISEQMWRNVEKRVTNVADFSRLVETLNFMTLNLYFDLAKDEGATFALVGDAGFGKSYTAKWYEAVHRKRNVYYLECAEYWNKKMFLGKLLQQMGKNGAGLSVGEMMEQIIRTLHYQEKPLIILDEVDKLPDPVLKFFITLYNDLNKLCGFIWLSTDAIEKRITKGTARNTPGYKELFSRVGASFIELRKPSIDEIRSICELHGITGEAQAEVVNEVLERGGDLRRVDRSILKNKVKKLYKSRKAA